MKRAAMRLLALMYHLKVRSAALNKAVEQGKVSMTVSSYANRLWLANWDKMYKKRKLGLRDV